MKNKARIFIIVAIIILFALIFFASEPTGKQAFFKPVFVSEITETQAKNNLKDSSDLIPFVSGKCFGYHDKNAKLIFAKPIENNFSICTTMWTNYEFISPFESMATDMVDPAIAKIMQPDGSILLRDNRIFVFLTSGNSICEYDSNGKLLWAYSMPGIITAFDCNSDFVVLGSSEGAVACIDKSGKEKFNFYPGGSNVEIIYGLALSTNGEKIACLCGLDQQRLILIELNDYHKIIFHIFLENSLRRQVTMFFDNDSKYLFSETADGVVILNCDNFKFTKTNIKERLTSTYVEVAKKGFGILTQNPNEATLTFFDLKCRQFATTSFKCTSSSMSQFGEEFFLIADEKILKFELNEL